MVDKVKIVRAGPQATRVSKLFRESAGTGEIWMRARTQILKQDAFGLVGLLESDEVACVLKFYRFKSRLHRFGYTFGRGRALRSYKAAMTLRREGIAVPQPLGCLRLPDGMVVLSEAIAGEGNLQEVWERQPLESAARRIMQVAGHTLAHLHLCGYAHGDCKWNNFLWDGRSICMVDLDGVSKAAIGSAKQARDVARFTVNAEEQGLDSSLFNLFLESYLQAVGETRQEAVARMVPFVYSMRAKHLARYGPRGQRLV